MQLRAMLSVGTCVMVLAVPHLTAREGDQPIVSRGSSPLAWLEGRGVQAGKSNAGEDGPPQVYGVAAVSVERGAGPAAVWASYSTRLGSPVGDTAGGAFRFTCSTANAPCKVYVSAAVLSKTPGTGGIYPRVLIHRQDFVNPGPSSYCEYADGSFTAATPNGIALVPTQTASATPSLTPVTVHIGGSADCGGPDPAAGAVPRITVPAGYYDVSSTFTFFKP